MPGLRRPPQLAKEGFSGANVCGTVQGFQLLVVHVFAAYLALTQVQSIDTVRPI